MCLCFDGVRAPIGVRICLCGSNVVGLCACGLGVCCVCGSTAAGLCVCSTDVCCVCDPVTVRLCVCGFDVCTLGV